MKKLTLIPILLILIFASAESMAANAETHFEYLRSVFNQHQDHMEEFLVYEIEAFIKTYPDHSSRPEAMHLLAEVYLEDGDEDAAFGQLTKTLFLYPNSNIHSTIVGDVHKIVAEDGDYEDQSDFITTVVDGSFNTGSESDRYFDYIRFLHDVNIEDLYEWTLKEGYAFTAKFRDDPRVEMVMRWIADIWYEDGKEEAAVNGYLKYEELYPESEHLPYVMIKRANILNKEMKEVGDALALLTRVVEEFPGTDYAATALFDRALIKQDRNDDYEGAITDYRAMVEMKPQHVKAVDALLAIARIQEDEMKAYRTSIKVYDEIIEGYPVDVRGIDALKESAEICEDLDDYKCAADRLAQITTQFPEYEDAPKMAFEAADIARGKMKNLHKAIEYLNIVVEQYPDSEASRKAEKEIGKLQEKLNK